MINRVEFSEAERQNQRIDKNHLETILKEFRRDGYVVLKDVFSKEYVELLHQHFISNYDRYFVDKEHIDALAVGDKRFEISVDVSGPFNSAGLYAHPVVFPIMQQLLGNKCIISDITCITSLPGSQKMGVHCDGKIFKENPLAPMLPPHAVGLLIPLIPFTALNGPTRVWPGSHRVGPTFENVPDKMNFVDVEIDTGSCILMDHRLYHEGNPNYSEQVRPLLYINYSVPWYYDPDNFRKQAPLLVSDAEFDRIPDQHKPLFVRRHILFPKSDSHRSAYQTESDNR